jgi:hypothetical protein
VLTISVFTKIRPVETVLIFAEMRTGGQTDIQSDFAKASKIFREEPGCNDSDLRVTVYIAPDILGAN